MSAIRPQGLASSTFLAMPEREEGDAARELRRACGVRAAQLVVDLREADDRPGDELREHRDEAGEVDEVAQRPRVAAVDVDRVAHRLEGVEADAERQGRPRARSRSPRRPGRARAATPFQESTAKWKYLKKPSSVRFEVSETASAIFWRRVLGSPRGSSRIAARDQGVVPTSASPAT